MGDTVIQGGYMVCSSCGVDLPNNSQFCRYCGRAQSVASTSVGAAAAQPKRGAAGWILGALFLLLCCPQASGSAIQTFPSGCAGQEALTTSAFAATTFRK
jgi:predicted amidophosphoribosyltransferase